MPDVVVLSVGINLFSPERTKRYTGALAEEVIFFSGAAIQCCGLQRLYRYASPFSSVALIWCGIIEYGTAGHSSV